MQTTAQPPKPKISEWIKKTLDDLTKTQLKDFHFSLQDYTGSENESIPWSKLEEADTMDTTKLITGHYGNEGALQVTMDILKEINQYQLASQLENKMGKTTHLKTFFNGDSSCMNLDTQWLILDLYEITDVNKTVSTIKSGVTLTINK